MNAPKKIWLQDGGDYDIAMSSGDDVTWCVSPIDDNDTEFVRADLFAAEKDRADKAEALASDLQAKLTDCCLQALATDGQAIEALERAEKAEALLAEAVEAMRPFAITHAWDGTTRFEIVVAGQTGRITGADLDRARATLAKIKEAKA